MYAHVIVSILPKGKFLHPHKLRFSLHFPIVSRIASLLGARLEELKRTITQHKFNSRRESVYIRACSAAEAERRVETLMKFMYQL